MNSVLERIEQLSDRGSKTASEIYKETFGMSDKELALYLGNDANANKVAKLLGVQNLVTKDANQALAKDFYELRSRGRQMMNPDRAQMLDVYNEKLKDVPYYMEKFGLPTEQGKYKVEDQIKFLKNIDKLDPVELQNLANQEGFATADQMRNEIKRTGERLVGELARQGRSTETGSVTPMYFAKGAAGLIAPRIHEANEMGNDITAADIGGDAVELGLNFVPGMSAASKGARLLSKFKPFKNLPGSVATRIASGAAEMGAAPIGSQAYDYAVYDKADPRGQWDWSRVGAQSAGALAGLGTVKGLGAQGKNLLEGTAGKSGATNAAKSLMDVAENIGNDAKENIARRQLVMERKAELARNKQYTNQNFLTAKQNESGYFATADDLADAEDFAIKKSEAERFANTQKTREKYDKLAEQSGLTNLDATDIDANGVVTIHKPDGTTEYLEINPDVLFDDDAVVNEAIINAWSEKHPEAAGQMEELFNRLSDYGDNPLIIQLPDGRFVKGETVFGTPGKPEVKGKIYTDDFDDGLDASSFTVLKNNDEVPLGQWEDIELTKEGDPTINVSYKPRDPTVRRELQKDRDFDAVASGRAKRQPLYNTAAYAGFNAAAREGIVGEGLGLDDKRESALWNRQLGQLRPLVQQGTPEYKQQMVDAIMNVMTYGLDQLPDDVFKANPNAYRAIANQLGSSDWKHNSEVGVADYPTTSYSSAR